MDKSKDYISCGGLQKFICDAEHEEEARIFHE